MKYAVRIYNYPEPGKDQWAYITLSDKNANTDINKVYKDKEYCDLVKCKIEYEYVVEEYDEERK